MKALDAASPEYADAKKLYEAYVSNILNDLFKQGMKT